MKKHIIIFSLIFFITIGFASVSTVLDIKGNVNIAENLEDFKIEITNLKINDINQASLISNDKKSFTFTGTGNDALEYTVTNYSYQYDANINLVCTPNDNVTIEQINNLSAQNRITKTIKTTNASEITCTINVEKISRTDYAEDMCNSIEGTEWTFDYTGKEQEFVAPCNGNYKVELWGAQGGDSGTGGKGAYTSGDIILENSKIFVFVGGNGYQNKGYNGGGMSIYNGFSGGGSTDLRIESDNLFSRIMVAAGGSGSSYFSEVWNKGVPGGGLVGYDGEYLNYNCSAHSRPVKNPAGGATQTSGGKAMVCENGSCLHGVAYSGSFFYGARDNSPIAAEAQYGSGGGGAGWYGGGGGTTTNCDITSSASGSSYISGHKGAIGTQSSTSHVYDSSCISVPTIDCSKSYSGYVFTNTVMIDGAGYKWTNVKGEKIGMPTHDGTGTMIGNSGNGYAKITYLGK